MRDAAFVYCGRRKIYLGKWGAPETIAAYRRYIAELASDRVSVAESAEAEKTVVTVAELAVAFLSDKKDYYVKDGASTRQHERYRVALSFPVEFFPATPVDDFGPKKLLFCRDEMEKSGRRRAVVYQHVNQLRSNGLPLERRARTRSPGNARRSASRPAAQTRQVDRSRSRPGRTGFRPRRRRDAPLPPRPRRRDGSAPTPNRNATRRSLRDAFRRRRPLRRGLDLHAPDGQNGAPSGRVGEEARPARSASASDFNAATPNFVCAFFF